MLRIKYPYFKHLLWAFAAPFVVFILLPAFSTATGVRMDPAKSLSELDLKTIDWRFRIRGEQSPRAKIVLVTIDETSAKKFGEPPWSRIKHAQLVRYLSEAGARCVVFDMVFATPDPREPEGDRAFVAAIKEAGNVVLAFQGTRSSIVQPPKPELFSRFSLPYISRSQSDVPSIESVEAPFSELLESAQAVGFIDVPQDADGRFRHTLLLLNYENQAYPSLDLAATATFLGLKPSQLKLSDRRQLLLGEQAIRMPENAVLLVNFIGGEEAFERNEYSFAHVLAGKIDPKRFEDAIVLVGVTLKGAIDVRPTPFTEELYGVEIHAHTIHSILQNSLLRESGGLISLAFCAFFALLTGLAIPRIRFWQGFTGLVVISAAYTYAAVRAFLSTKLCLEVVPPLSSLGMSYITVSLYMLATERKAKDNIRRSLERYVAPTVAKQIVENPEISLAMGERRYITVFFADIRNFTVTAERVDPLEVVGLLNLFFQRTSNIVFQHKGIVDKYIGDCIMAVFGAVGEDSDHAQQAAAAALEIQKEARLMQEEWRFEGALTDLTVTIGINTGQAVLGEVGSERHTQYTAIGDTVNLASRLEGLCRHYGANILVSRSTYDLVADFIEAQHIGAVSVRGKREPVEIFSVLGTKEELKP